MKEDFYRGIVEGLSCGLLTVDARQTVITVNDLARQVLELAGEVEGRSCGEVLAHHPRLVEVLRGAASCSTLASRAEIELRTRGGCRRAIGYSISRIRGSPPGDSGLTLFFKDLTQVERLAEQERLRDRLAALGEMAAQMAHEIRNPITSISITAQLARRGCVEMGQPTEWTDRVIADASRVESAIANCLEYVRTITPELQPEPLRALLETAAAEAVRQVGGAATRIEIACSGGLESVPCDAVRLGQVFVNLLINSVEAMEGGGAVRIEATAEDPAGGGRAEDRGWAVIRISDTGPGIPENLRDRVFYPFFTTKSRGTGIGLAMARKIVDLHRGVIDLTSEPGCGATFTIRLPLGSGLEREAPERMAVAAGADH